MDTKICIAIVSNRSVKPKTVLSLLQLDCPFPKFVCIASQGYTIAESRNYCVIQAKKNACTHILFVDDDMFFPSDTLSRLIACEKEVVGVYSFSRQLPLCPTVAFLDEKGEHLPHDKIPQFVRPDSLFKCFSVGMGVCLIHLPIFEKIEKPWFAFETHESGKIMIGEDAWFCRQAQKAGLDIWCEPRLEVKHLGEFAY